MVMLVGCTTAYKPDGFSGGFSETQLDQNTWKVTFRGNGYTHADQASDLSLLRAADLTIQNGFTHFGIIDSKSDSEISSYTAPSTSQTSYYGTHAVTQHFGGNTSVNSKPSATNTIVMFKGKPDSQGMIYDASFICQSIGAKYETVCGKN